MIVMGYFGSSQKLLKIKGPGLGNVEYMSEHASSNRMDNLAQGLGGFMGFSLLYSVLCIRHFAVPF